LRGEIPVSAATKNWRDPVGVLEDARDRAGELLGRPLIEDCTERETRAHADGLPTSCSRIVAVEGGSGPAT
jgi:hypothetical protein